MSKSDELFHQIVNDSPDIHEGKMFGTSCLKSMTGKAIAILWKGNMLFKLDEKVRQEALELDGASISSHLYAPEKPMKGWITIPLKHSDKWPYFAEKATVFVNTLEKK